MDSIKNGVVLEDGRCLGIELSKTEQKELENYVMELLLPEIETASRFKRRRMCLDSYKAEELNAILMMKVYEDFYKFNNPRFITDKSKKYAIQTFIDHKAHEAMRDLLVQERDLPVNAIRNLRLVTNAIIEIAEETEVTADDVTPEMVAEKLADKSISLKMIMSLMEIYHGNVSIEDMTDSDFRLQDNTMDLENKFVCELEESTEAVLNSVIGKFSKLELFIMMKEFGFFGEKTKSMTAKELSYKDYFVAMAREDKDGDKNIEFGSVHIKHPGRNTQSDDEILVEEVFYVKEKFYSNKVAKIKKKLAELAGQISMGEVEGCLEGYCWKKWREW